MSAADDDASAMGRVPPERTDADAQRLAAGFAEHVVRWAQRVARGAAQDEARLSLLRRCAHATSLATTNGLVCILLSALAQPGEDVAGMRATLLSSGVVGTPEQPASLPLILDDDGRLYLHRYFDYEVRLARRLMQTANGPRREVGPAARELLNSLFAAGSDAEVDWQKIAAAMALRGSLTVISGGPGTGKTTTVVNLLGCLLAQEPHTRTALAAPTGKAAARMTEAIRQRAHHLPPALRAKLPQESFTIHRLLGANAAQGRFTHDAANPIAFDVLVVDEASMVDLALATRLFEAVPVSARIVLLGDKDQLAAVEAGAVFAELGADPSLSPECRRDLAELCGYAPERLAPPAPAQPSRLRDAAVWLTKNYRFPAESGIGRLARCINDGAVQEALALLRASRDAQAGASAARAASREFAAASQDARGKDAKRRVGDAASLSLFPELEPVQEAGADPDAAVAQREICWLDPEQGDDMLEASLAGYDSYFDAVRSDASRVETVFRALERFRVLCAVREGPQGVAAINERVARHARTALRLATDTDTDRPELRSPWYVGRPVVVNRNDYVNRLFNGDIGITLPLGGQLAVYFADGEGGFRTVPIARMPSHDTAFAMTVHKAQGSEFDHVLLALPRRESRVAGRELLYTAVTRARSRVSIFASAEVLAAGVRLLASRDSGLFARLRAAT